MRRTGSQRWRVLCLAAYFPLLVPLAPLFPKENPRCVQAASPQACDDAPHRCSCCARKSAPIPSNATNSPGERAQHPVGCPCPFCPEGEDALGCCVCFACAKYVSQEACPTVLIAWSGAFELGQRPPSHFDSHPFRVLRPPRV